MYTLQPIPEREFELPSVAVEEGNEELVDISDYKCDRIIVKPYYFEMGFPHASGRCLMRKTVAEKLVAASAMLPNGLCFKIFDAWRPFEVQEQLYLQYRNEVKLQNPLLDEGEIDILTQRFVSEPKRIRNVAPVHSSGGAVDLTLSDENGRELCMGTEFDDFSPMANTAYFENEKSGNEEARRNRRILYNLMALYGFTNLPTEWWHYDYGDRFWAHYSGNKAFYSGIF